MSGYDRALLRAASAVPIVQRFLEVPRSKVDAGLDYEHAQAKIEACLRALPIETVTQSDAIPYADLIPGLARQILLMRGTESQEKLRKDTVKYLSKFNASANRLLILLDSELLKDPLKPPVRSSLLITLIRPSDVLALFKLRKSLNKLTRSLTAARDMNLRAGSRGRRRNITEDALGIFLFHQYERLTGSKPTRIVKNGRAGGLFHQLVSDVFSALKITASPEATVARVMEKMKRPSDI